MSESRIALGLMTGTALDGCIDAALVRTDGENVEALGGWRLHPYGETLRGRLAAAIRAARDWNFSGPEPDEVSAVERDFTLAHADAVRALVSASGYSLAAIDVIGLHGLTVLHRGAREGVIGATRQIGDGALLARALGVDVAFDFRACDVAAGGQGSPLAPAYHAALNLGGVANITWVGADGSIVAFDTGPANGPINEWMELRGLGVMDEGGRIAASGSVHEDVVARALAHPYFSAPYPKSLDRYDFSASLAEGLSNADGAATLTAISAAAVGRGLDLLPERPTKIVVCGGGRKNPTLMREIGRRARVEVVNADAIGWRGDAIEAEAFAFLAVRVLDGLPLSFPTTTGVSAPTIGGRIARAR